MIMLLLNTIIFICIGMQTILFSKYHNRSRSNGGKKYLSKMQNWFTKNTIEIILSEQIKHKLTVIKEQ